MAGFFGFFDYTKPGPGVPKDAPPKHRLIVFFEVYFRKFWKLVQLNMLYTIASIPFAVIPTAFLFMVAVSYFSEAATMIWLIIFAAGMPFAMGPATAGFTYVLRNYSREEHAWVWSDFKEHAFKNFKQALLVYLIDLIAVFIGYVNLQFYSQMAASNILFGYLKYVVIAMGIIFAMMHFYIYPMMVTFKLSFKQLYKNAFIFAIVKLPMNLLMLVIYLAVTIGFYYYYIIGAILTPFIVISTLGFIINFYVYPVLEKYMISRVSEEPEDAEITSMVEEGKDELAEKNSNQ